MGLRDWAIRKLGGIPFPVQPQGRTHVLQAGNGLGFDRRGVALNRKQIVPGCRVGMFVRWEGRTGIATGLTTDGLIAVDLLADSGETMLTTHQPWSSLRQATINEIPEPRRNVGALRGLGYQE